MDAGHFVSRVYESTLFDERNVHAQCKGCNMPPNNGMGHAYWMFLDGRYGAGTASSIKDLAKRRSMGRHELESILEKYTRLNKEQGNGWQRN